MFLDVSVPPNELLAVIVDNGEAVYTANAVAVADKIKLCDKAALYD